MKKNLHLILAVFLAAACSGLPQVKDVPTRTVTPVNTTMKQAIFQGGAKKGWAMYEVTPGEVEGQLMLRGHEVRVRIPYTANTYAIHYAGSLNMSYNAKKNTIHRKYNQWVQNLDLEIRRAVNGNMINNAL